MASFNIVIPARYGSSRLPGKPLLELAGRPMIVHVCERALEAGGKVFVATDDQRICDAVSHLPVRAVITRKDHANGSQRIAEVVDRLGWSDDEIIVNLQGDEPLMRPSLVRHVAAALVDQSVAQVATLAVRIESRIDVFDPNAVRLCSIEMVMHFILAVLPFLGIGLASLKRAHCYPITFHISGILVSTRTRQVFCGATRVGFRLNSKPWKRWNNYVSYGTGNVFWSYPSKMLPRRVSIPRMICEESGRSYPPSEWV